MKKTVTVNYRLGYTRKSDWFKSAYFCPNCGKQDVWFEDDDGDYFLGERYACTSCKCLFTIQGPYVAENTDVQIIEQLK